LTKTKSYKIDIVVKLEGRARDIID